MTKAYRTLCDECASRRNVCSSCCTDLQEAILLSKLTKGEQDELETENDTTGMLSSEKVDTIKSEGGESNIFEGYLDDMEDDHRIETEAMPPVSTSAPEESAFSTTSEWDENKYLLIARSKYSKSRVIGDPNNS